jgi:hypothetical protein
MCFLKSKLRAGSGALQDPDILPLGRRNRMIPGVIPGKEVAAL